MPITDDRLLKKIKKAKRLEKKLDLEPVINLSKEKIHAKINSIVKNLRRKRPKNSYNYISLVDWYVEDKEVKHSIIGYIRDKTYLSKLIDYLKESDHISSEFSDKFIKSTLEEFYKDFYMNKYSKEEVYSKIVSTFNQSHKWVFLFPLHNIELKLKKFRIGNGKLLIFTKNRKKNWIKDINIFFKQKGWKDGRKNQLKFFEKDYQRFLENQCCVEITIFAGDSNIALERAKVDFEKFIDIFIFIIGRWYNKYNDHKIMMSDESLRGWKATIGFSKTGGSGGVYENHNPSPLVLDSHIKKHVMMYGIKNINKILDISEKNRTQFQKNILNSLILYGKATAETNNAIAYIQYVSILELNLIQRNEQITKNLAERLAILLQRKFPDRIKYEEYVRTLYSKRGDILHKGEYAVDENYMKNIKIVTLNLILLLINIHNKYTSKTDFISTITELKMGRKYTFYKRQIYLSW